MTIENGILIKNIILTIKNTQHQEIYKNKKVKIHYCKTNTLFIQLTRVDYNILIYTYVQHEKKRFLSELMKN